MKRLLAWWVLGMLGMAALVSAQSPDEIYVRIYHLIQQADEQMRTGQLRPAYDKFTQAQSALQQMQRGYPTWQENLVKYRLNYVQQRLGQIPASAIAAAPTASSQVEAAAAPAGVNPVASTASPAELQGQVRELSTKVQRLESEKNLLEAKLREALSAQPATIDPRELTRAEERIRGLQKENDLLKITLDQEQERSGKLIDPSVMAKTQKALEDANRRLSEQVQLVATLTQEKKLLENRLSTGSPRAETQALQKENTLLKKQVGELSAQLSLLASRRTEGTAPEPPPASAATLVAADVAAPRLAALETQVAAQKTEITKLQTDKSALEQQLAERSREQAREQAREAKRRERQERAERKARVKALESEKHALEKELDEWRARESQGLSRSERRELTRQREQTDTLRTKNRDLEQENQALTKEIAALKNRVTSLPTPASPSADLIPVADTRQARQAAKQENARIEALEKERDALKRRLDTLIREQNRRGEKGDEARWRQMSNQVMVLQARLAALEAPKPPYTPEERALMHTPLILASNTNGAGPGSGAAQTNDLKKAQPNLPGGAAPLVAEAQRAFAARRYEEAEQKYRQVLALDGQNAFTLGNLAAIEIEQKKYAEADAHLQKALELDPKDAFNLSLMGILRFRQEKFDDALTALSQAAQLDPKNAETQNYLGITLSEKGFRDAAEAALRRAIQLQPDYANAHHNLAVIYAIQNPPYLELARWHYQKALAAGHPRNPEMEKVLLDKRPPATSQQ